MGFGLGSGRSYDVIIVGGGIIGTSLLYTLSRYSNVRSVLLIEKYGSLAQIASKSSSNSQTLHFGDIETNYSLKQAEHTKKQAQILLRYLNRIPAGKRRGIAADCQKMVLGVGGKEVRTLEKIYDSGIKRLFPGLKRIDRKVLSRIEPNVVKGRDPRVEIGALLSDNGKMVDFGRLSDHFVSDAKRNRRVRIDVMFNAKAQRANRVGDLYHVHTTKGSFTAGFVAFATGTYSLYFAKSLGYGESLSVLSVGGNFYYSKRVLNGKVYRVQVGGVPFAAVHGDPDINRPDITRFGPTVNMPIGLEKGRSGTALDYLRSFDFDIATLQSLRKIFSDRDIKRIVTKNMFYSMPLIGKEEFLKNEASLIVPSLRYGDLKFGGAFGGIRPQIVDESKRKLILGLGKIHGDGLLFNITPSPGASACLGSAFDDSTYITEYLGRSFDSERFGSELGSPD